MINNCLVPEKSGLESSLLCRFISQLQYEEVIPPTTSLGNLQKKLSHEGVANVSFMIVNEKTPFSRAMYWELKRQAPEGIPVYQQEILEPDVWQILDGDKDDFLIYDRCSRLAFHIQLPYSFLHLPYVEAAVHYTNRKDYCGNCSWYHLNNSLEVQ
ncbi:hypothetical protein lerEdw1_018788 [Lerista edwardsae]|nr:hypothetical protein lerEdw1_018788 [Lerista edwardsae]